MVQNTEELETKEGKRQLHGYTKTVKDGLGAKEVECNATFLFFQFFLLCIYCTSYITDTRSTYSSSSLIISTGHLQELDTRALTIPLTRQVEKK